MAINLTSGGLNGLTHQFSTSSQQLSAPSVGGWVSLSYTKSGAISMKLPSSGTYFCGFWYPSSYSGSYVSSNALGTSLSGGATVVSLSDLGRTMTANFSAVRLS